MKGIFIHQVHEIFWKSFSSSIAWYLQLLFCSMVFEYFELFLLHYYASEVHSEYDSDTASRSEFLITEERI